ncbi:Uncharacterized protein dnl_14840 [Desulfonema limicola]|uniref:Uncharacterized protein n=1 Tax=Desulfonema limicola TaxID=45656 RepID=A0A975GFG9_9BACT|nr:Uncharacterized protein dnl_14840 [Desulfonema limicola]
MLIKNKRKQGAKNGKNRDGDETRRTAKIYAGKGLIHVS